ncbi:uncharacterized protein LOC143022485 [Oratosquilla oratoria]|uniref:uncharacterized protein LOC143022485 n=1 Tax=Oratosquilla oratoria TaxID=337810 RepID=UPI003F76CF94
MNKTERLKNIRQKNCTKKINCAQNSGVKELKVMFSNVDVFCMDKLNELKAKINEDKEPPQIIAIQEVKPKNYRYERDIIEYIIQGYEIYGENLKQGVDRGLLLYVKEDIQHERVVFENRVHEYIAIRIRGRSEDVLFGTMYRSLNSDVENNNNLLDLLQETSEVNVRHKVVVGDFNVPNIDWDDLTVLQGEDMLSHNFIEKCNIEPQGKKCRKLVYMYEKANFVKLKELLAMDWTDFFINADTEEMWERFKLKMQSAIDECVPKRQFKSSTRKRTNQNLPMNTKLWRLIKKKQRLWARLKKMKEDREDNISEYSFVQEGYRQTNNKVRWETRRAVKRVEKSIAENVKENPKAFWKYIQSKTKSSVSVRELYMNAEKTLRTKNDKEKANILGEFFSSVFTQEPEGEIPTLAANDVPEMPPFEFTDKEIGKVIDKLQRDKSPGPDGLHPRILKEVKAEIISPLKLIFNSSLQTSKIPVDWKIANITAIFKKKGDRSEPENYRPVCLTCVICKLMESIIHGKVLDHLNKYKLISGRQNEFVNGRSTVLQLITVIEEWTKILDMGGGFDVAHCDFMKAFNKVPHRRLIEKVSSCNIKGLEVD